MRTTVTIDDTLLRRAKELAAQSGRNLGDIVDDGLRLLLVDREPPHPSVVNLPTFGGSGLRPGVVLEDKEALAALLEDEG